MNGIPARIWLGKTEGGVEFVLLVTLVAVAKTADSSQFEQELQEQPVPHVSQAFSLRMVI
jgi:hypothetical protein